LNSKPHWRSELSPKWNSLLAAAARSELRSLEKFLRRFQILKLNPQSSDTSVDLLRRYRLSHGLLIADALIAATALSLDIPFVTKNQSDYRFISGLRLLPYPQPFAAEH
jgi:predicted nucleic acid-binding protein